MAGAPSTKWMERHAPAISGLNAFDASCNAGSHRGQAGLEPHTKMCDEGFGGDRAGGVTILYYVTQQFVGCQLLLSVVLRLQSTENSHKRTRPSTNKTRKLSGGQILEDRRRIMSERDGSSTPWAGKYSGKVAAGGTISQKGASVWSIPCHGGRRHAGKGRIDLFEDAGRSLEMRVASRGLCTITIDCNLQQNMLCSAENLPCSPAVTKCL